MHLHSILELSVANAYTSFSETIVLNTAEEVAWCRTSLQEIEALLEEGVEDVDQVKPEDKAFYDAESLGFTYHFEEDDKSLSFIAEESGEPESVAIFVQQFLHHFNLKTCFTLAWAATCSRPLVGNFGGGAVYVTADSIEWVNTFDWTARKIAAHETASGTNSMSSSA